MQNNRRMVDEKDFIQILGISFEWLNFSQLTDNVDKEFYSRLVIGCVNLRY
jgi:hypothetical protein